MPTDAAALTILGDRIRALRHERGWSQEDLAEHADLHWSFVSHVERGSRNLSLRSLLKISHGLQVDPAVLVAGLEPWD